MARVRQLLATLDGVDVLALYGAVALFVGLWIVAGLGVALVVHGVLGLAVAGAVTVRAERVASARRGI